MKKVYTSILTACTAVLASAAVPTMTPAQGTLVPSNVSKEVKLTRSMHLDGEIADFGKPALKKSPAKAHESDKWESLGEATFYEGIVSPIYGISSAPTYKVAVEKSTTTSGLYRVAEPYKAFAADVQFTYDATKAEPMYIQVCGDNQFYIESFNTGMTDPADDGGEIVINSNAYNLVSGNGVDACLQAVPDAFGNLADGVFSYASPTFSLSGSTYYSLLVGIGDTSAGYYRGNANNEFKLVLPGGVIKDYKIGMDYDNCADDNKFTLQFALGADVANYKIFITPGEFPKSTENFSFVAEKGQSFTKDQTGLTYQPATTDPEGIYTVFAVSLDESGAYKEGVRGLLFVHQEKADKWTALTDKALYTDDFVASIYKNHDDTEREVVIEESNETPGYYRLVNPYVAPYAFAQNIELNCTHNHYLYINASDPDKVYVEESAIGFDYGDGAMTVSSNAYYSLQNEAEVADTDWGKLKDNVITFPTKTLLARELKYNDATWYYANTNGAFKVKLPETGAVGSIAVDNVNNAPVEYFNLQGQRVDNPAAGQLVVKRQGSKVEKVLVR